MGIIVGIEGTNEAFRSGLASTGPRGGGGTISLEERPSPFGVQKLQKSVKKAIPEKYEKTWWKKGAPGTPQGPPKAS